MHLVVTGRIEPAQIRRVGDRPVLEVGPGPIRVALLAAIGGDLGVQRVQMAFQRGGEFTGRAGAPVRLDEERAEEGQDQRGVAGAQQSPGGVPLPKGGNLCVIHTGNLGIGLTTTAPTTASGG